MLRRALDELRCAGLLAWSLVALGTGWLGYGFWRLCLVAGRDGGGVDLRLRWREVEFWWRGLDLYRDLPDAMYPPASYLLFTPLLGWGSFGTVRLVYAGLQVLCLIALGVALHRAAGGTRRQRWLLVALALASYPLGAGIGNGQVALPVLVLVIAAVHATRVVPMALALTGALIKPTLGGPFVIVLLARSRGVAAVALAGTLYLGLTLGATLPIGASPLERMGAWAERGVEGAHFGASRGEGSMGTRNRRSLESAVRVGAGRGPTAAQWRARNKRRTKPRPFTIKSVNVHSVLAWGRLHGWMTLGTLATVLLTWAWVVRRRTAPIWTQLGVVGIATVLCTYHAWYDHAVLLLPLVALQRIATGLDPGGLAPSRARALAVLLGLSLLAPGGLYLLPHPLNNAYVVAQTVVWLAVAASLVVHARRPPVR